MNRYKAGVALAIVLSAASTALVGASGLGSNQGTSELARTATSSSVAKSDAAAHTRSRPALTPSPKTASDPGAAPAAAQPETPVEPVTSTSAHGSSEPWEALPFGLDCLELVPTAAGVAGLTDDGRTVTLEVLVLVDRMYGLDRAMALMERAADAFVPLDIRLEPTYESIDFEGTEVVPLLEQARAAASRFSLDRIDVVHVLTGVDLTFGGSRGVGGMASCIGGIRYKERLQSLSVSEGWYQDAGSIWPTGTLGYKDRSALIVAHEIGHLLGAHHHYGNCIDNVDPVAAAERRMLSPCTVMDQTLAYSSLRFGHVEGAVVRGHAVRYASP